MTAAAANITRPNLETQYLTQTPSSLHPPPCSTVVPVPIPSRFSHSQFRRQAILLRHTWHADKHMTTHGADTGSPVLRAHYCSLLRYHVTCSVDLSVLSESEVLVFFLRPVRLLAEFYMH